MISRQMIADVLASVEGLIASPSNPDTVIAGGAWPRWVQTTFEGRLCDDQNVQWDVFVCLPAGYLPDTVEVGDQLVPAVATVLANLGDVELCEPVTIGFDDQTSTPGLRFRLVTV
jgi:hypothetical protein